MWERTIKPLIYYLLKKTSRETTLSVNEYVFKNIVQRRARRRRRRERTQKVHFDKPHKSDIAIKMLRASCGLLSGLRYLLLLLLLFLCYIPWTGRQAGMEVTIRCIRESALRNQFSGQKHVSVQNQQILFNRVMFLYLSPMDRRRRIDANVSGTLLSSAPAIPSFGCESIDSEYIMTNVIS